MRLVSVVLFIPHLHLIMHKSISITSFFMGKGDENSCMQLTDTKGECQRVRGNASALPALSHSRMMKVSLCTLRLSVTELTSSLLFYNWNPRLSVCLSVTWRKKKQINTREFDEVLLRVTTCQRMLSLCPLKTGHRMDTASCHLQSTCKCK